MNSGTANAESRYAGICVVFASLLFLISAAVHGVIHREVGASAVDSMTTIAQRATVWQVALLFCAYLGGPVIVLTTGIKNGFTSMVESLTVNKVIKGK